MYKIGLSSCGKTLNRSLFEKYRAAGIDCIEISPSFEEYKTVDYKAIKKYSDENNVSLWSYHLPFWYPDVLDISSPDENIRTSSVEIMSELIKKAADIGIKIFVVHPSSEPVSDENRDMQLEKSGESLCILAETAARCGAEIAVEDLPRSCLGHDSDEILKLISADPRLRVCFDTNHLLIEDNVDFVARLGKKIITLHVSDYDFVNERHWLPGEGKIDWNELYTAIKSAGYNGAWLYEVGFKCPQTIYRDRDLCCEDFSENAHEIFAGLKPAIFSSPKPNLGMWE